MYRSLEARGHGGSRAGSRDLYHRIYDGLAAHKVFFSTLGGVATVAGLIIGGYAMADEGKYLQLAATVENVRTFAQKVRGDANEAFGEARKAKEAAEATALGLEALKGDVIGVRGRIQQEATEREAELDKAALLGASRDKSIDRLSEAGREHRQGLAKLSDSILTIEGAVSKAKETAEKNQIALGDLHHRHARLSEDVVNQMKSLAKQIELQRLRDEVASLEDRLSALETKRLAKQEQRAPGAPTLLIH